MRALSLLSGLLIGCQSPAENPEDTAAAAGAPPPPENGVQLVLEDIAVPAYSELEMCRYLKAENAVDGHVVAIDLYAEGGLHHSFVVKSAMDIEDGEEPCFGLPEALMSGFNVPEPLFASSTQVSAETLVFPDGVGVPFGALQQVMFNYHFLNATDEDVEGKIWMNLHFAEDAADIEEAGLFAFGNMGGIDIPAGGSQSLTTTCAFDEDVSVFSVTPHMHSLGTGFSVDTSAGEPLLQTQGWYNPESVYFEPPLAFAAGEGLTFTCEWENPTGDDVGFGESASEEMCFVFGYHWPASGLYFKADYNGCAVE